jgi:excisionase family DNA binding protein
VRSEPATTPAGLRAAGRRLVTTREVAVLLGCSERYVWGLGDSGELPRVTLGRSVKFDLDDVERFIARAKARAPASANGSGRT